MRKPTDAERAVEASARMRLLSALRRVVEAVENRDRVDAINTMNVAEDRFIEWQCRLADIGAAALSEDAA